MNGWRHPESVKRSLVFRFEDGHVVHVPITDASVFSIGGQTYAMEGIRELDITTPELAALEEAVSGDVDLGRPVAEWGSE